MVTLDFAATNLFGQDVGSVEVTVGGAVVSPVFYDGFEDGTGSYSHSENGYSWANTSGSPDSESGDGAPVFAGDWTGRFRQDSSQRNRMLQLKAGSPAEWLQEFWFEYQIRIPDNYDHTCGTPTNNKWAEFFYTPNRDGLLIAPGTRMNAAQDGGSRLRVAVNSWRSFGERNVTDSWITLADRGSYVRNRYYVKLGTPGLEDGHIKIWKNETRVYDNNAMHFNGTTEANNWIGVFQIMGFNNCRFPERITWYVDEVKLFNQDPGWV